MEMLCIESALHAIIVIASTRIMGTNTFARVSLRRPTKNRASASMKLETISTEMMTTRPRETEVRATITLDRSVITRENIKILRMRRTKPSSLSSGDAKKSVIALSIFVSCFLLGFFLTALLCLELDHNFRAGQDLPQFFNSRLQHIA